MRRTTLRLFIERLLLASLPLAAADCHGTAKGHADAATIADASSAQRDAHVADLAPRDLTTEVTARDLTTTADPTDAAHVDLDLERAPHDMPLVLDADRADLVTSLADAAPPDAAPLPDGAPSDPICTSPPAPVPPDMIVTASDCVGDSYPCEWFVETPTPPATVTDAGDIDPYDCFTVCRSLCRPYGGWYCQIDGTSCSGNAVIRCEIGCGAGRLPPRFALTDEPGGGVAGRFFARTAQLEAGSVDAFLQLADELTAHGAPRSLVRAALRSAGDERRHARAMTRLARRYGATVPAACVARVPPRPLAEVAADNAVEGCVRETYGALVATWQGRSAADPVVRRALQSIATDETRHAELGWSVARWAESKLGARACRSVRAARVAAVESILIDAERVPHEELVRVAGLPRAPQARHLAAAFVDSIRRGIDLA